MTLTIIIPGKPQPQQRMKATLRGDHAGVYEPAESRNWKATAQQHMEDAMRRAGLKPFDCPIAVVVTVIFPLPASQHRKRAPFTPRRWHTKANGDGDNIVKIVFDAGNRGVVWADDRLICVHSCQKYVAAQGESPCVKVEVTEIVHQPPQPEHTPRLQDRIEVVDEELRPLGFLVNMTGKQTPISGSAARRFHA